MKQSLTLLISAGILLQLSCKKTSNPAKPAEPTLPAVQTLAVTAIANETAISGFAITNQDTTTIIEEGIVWGTATAPSTDLSTKAFVNGDTVTHSFYMTNLNCSTEYFVRAYIITLSRETIYGNQLNFTVSQIANYDSRLTLSKIIAIDTILESYYVDKLFPSNGASFLNRLSLPPGIFMYVKFDSANNLRCGNGFTSRVCNTGDTMHFGPLNPGGFVSESAITVSPVFDTDPYSQSAGKFSIHVAGIAVTPNTTYRCKYYNDGYIMTNTTHQSIYYADTSACQIPCEFK
ncbi:MAG: hypothetical protein ABIQ31_11600 [Ferruginibacter sp.]